MPLLKEENVSSTPYSPLAGGRLARLWDSSSKRSQIDIVGHKKYDLNRDTDYPIVERAYELSLKKNVSQSSIALAWLFKNKQVGSIILGATKTKYIDEALEALEVDLTEDEIKYLEELYKPHKIIGALPRGNNN